MMLFVLPFIGLIGCALILVVLYDEWRTSRRYGQPYVTTTLGRLR